MRRSSASKGPANQGVLICCVAALCGGCGTIPAPDGSGAEVSGSAWLGNALGGSGDSEDSVSRPSGPFASARRIAVQPSTTIAVGGTIESPGQPVVYELGPVSAGDELEIEVTALTQGFDPAVGVFDEWEDSMDLNDDRHFYDRRLDPYLRFTIREDSQRCYAVVSSSARSESTGDYELSVTRTPGAPYAAPSGQIVYLNFRGQSQVVIGRRPAVDVPVFSGSLISPLFAQDTAELARLAVARVREDYTGYDVTILSSSEQNPPAAPHTTVHFGSYNPSLLGIADSVDSFNQQQVQEAIVFVDTFSVFLSVDPSVDEMAHALANVTSHEIGHLLGLNHTADPRGIMDTTAGLRQMLVQQSFRRSPLNRDTFAIGYQNAPHLLLRNVGGELDLINEGQWEQRARIYDPWYDEGPQTPIRSQIQFGTCCYGAH